MSNPHAWGKPLCTHPYFAVMGHINKGQDTFKGRAGIPEAIPSNGATSEPSVAMPPPPPTLDEQQVWCAVLRCAVLC